MSPNRVLVLVGVLVWLAAATAVGAAGFMAHLKPPFPQVILVTLTVALLALIWKHPPVRDFAFAVDLRMLVAVHVTRFVGFYFLFLHQRGELPYAFAVPGGWGDIAVASTALVVLALNPARNSLTRRVSFGWNLLGMLDILFVVGTAARLALAEPASMQALLRLPLSLLITFLVPIIIATHVLIFARLRCLGREHST